MSRFRQAMAMRVVPCDLIDEMPIDEQDDLSYEIDMIRNDVDRIIKRLQFLPKTQKVLARHLVQAEDRLNNCIMILRHRYYYEYYRTTKVIEDEE